MTDRWEPLGLRPGEMYLPDAFVQMEKWAVIACDQYTGKRVYWQQVERFVNQSPSALNMILPEIDLDQAEEKIPHIQQTMKGYLEQKIITPGIKEGFILVERSLHTGKRLGLVGMIDLEHYDFSARSISLVRPTEGTIMERIPPRLLIRQGAELEFSHVILFVDDPENLLFTAVSKAQNNAPALYDFELMKKGGPIKGWPLEGEKEKDAVYAALKKLLEREDGANPMLFAVGDGNHSLATAKVHWEKVKRNLIGKGQQDHPARYAMVEVQNLYDPSILIEPIHRIIYLWDEREMMGAWEVFALDRGISKRTSKTKKTLTIQTFTKTSYWAMNQEAEGQVFIQYVEEFFDQWLGKVPFVKVDYIHGEEEVQALVGETKGIGMILPPIAKEDVLPFIKKNGPYPRKSFSVGHADEKRFYLEGRKIR